jgi:hypothetical protein
MVTFVHPPDKDEDDGEDVPGSGGIEKKVKLLEEKPDV